MPQWASAMWARLESLISDMGSICIKVRSRRFLSSRRAEVTVFFLSSQVYTLEKVLKLKKDQNTQTTFLDEAMTVHWLSVSPM